MKIGTDGSLRSCRFSFVPARRPVGAGRLRRGADRLRPHRSGCMAAGDGLRFPGAGRCSCRGFSLRGALEGAWGGLLRSSVRGPAVFFRGQCVEDALLRVWAAASAGRCYGRYVVVCVGAGPAVFFGGSASRMPCRVRRCVLFCRFRWAMLRTICCDVRRYEG